MYSIYSAQIPFGSWSVAVTVFFFYFFFFHFSPSAEADDSHLFHFWAPTTVKIYFLFKCGFHMNFIDDRHFIHFTH